MKKILLCAALLCTLLPPVEAQRRRVAPSRAQSAWPRVGGFLPGVAVSDIAFAPDGKSMAAATLVGIKRWRVADSSELPALKEIDNVTVAAFSPDSKLIAGASTTSAGAAGASAMNAGVGEKGALCIWDAATGAVRAKLQPEAKINCLAFSPDGATLAAGTAGKTLILFDTQTGAVQKTYSNSPWPLYALSYSPDGKILQSYGAGYEDKDQVEKLYEPSRPWSTIKRHVSQGVVSVREVKTGGVIDSILVRNGTPDAAFSHNGRLLAVAGSDYLIGTARDHVQVPIGATGHSEFVRKTIPVSQWGKGLLRIIPVGASADDRNAPPPLPEQYLVPGSSRPALAFSQDGTLIATLEGIVYLKDRQRDPRWGQPAPEYADANKVAFSPDNSLLVVATQKGISIYRRP